MPIGAVRAFAGQIPRLRAEDALHTMDIAAMANSGRYGIDDVNAQRRDWMRQVDGGRRRAKRRPTRAQLAAMGIATIGPAGGDDEAGMAGGAAA